MTNATIHLQGIGSCPAIPSSELQVGMLLSWNYAPAEYEVVAIRDVSPKFIEVDERRVTTGVVYPGRRLKKDRLVAAEMPRR